jgi:hypothetical protein
MALGYRHLQGIGVPKSCQTGERLPVCGLEEPM